VLKTKNSTDNHDYIGKASPKNNNTPVTRAINVHFLRPSVSQANFVHRSIKMRFNTGLYRKQWFATQNWSTCNHFSIYISQYSDYFEICAKHEDEQKYIITTIPFKTIYNILVSVPLNMLHYNSKTKMSYLLIISTAFKTFSLHPLQICTIAPSGHGTAKLTMFLFLLCRWTH